eukprot:261608_1
MKDAIASILCIGVASYILYLVGSYIYEIFNPPLETLDDDSVLCEYEEFVDEEDEGLEISILFGSQIGEAEGLAFELQDECRKFQFNAKVYDLEYYRVNNLKNEKLVIFFLSTFCDEQPTDNALYFYQWLLQQSEINKPLLNLQFTVYGIGDTDGKALDEYLHKLGGKRMLEFEEMDTTYDALANFDREFNEYKQRLWQVLFPIQCKEYYNPLIFGYIKQFNDRVSIDIKRLILTFICFCPKHTI